MWIFVIQNKPASQQIRQELGNNFHLIWINRTIIPFYSQISLGKSIWATFPLIYNIFRKENIICTAGWCLMKYLLLSLCLFLSVLLRIAPFKKYILPLSCYLCLTCNKHTWISFCSSPFTSTLWLSLCLKASEQSFPGSLSLFDWN